MDQSVNVRGSLPTDWDMEFQAVCVGFLKIPGLLDSSMLRLLSIGGLIKQM